MKDSFNNIFNRDFITDTIEKITNESIVSTPYIPKFIKVGTITGAISFTPEETGTTFMVSSGTYTISLPNTNDFTITPGLFYRFILVEDQTAGETITINQFNNACYGTLLQAGSTSDEPSYKQLNGNANFTFLESAKQGDYYEFEALASNFWLVKGFSTQSNGLFTVPI
jgi:hypothetical protein